MVESVAKLLYVLRQDTYKNVKMDEKTLTSP